MKNTERVETAHRRVHTHKILMLKRSRKKMKARAPNFKEIENIQLRKLSLEEHKDCIT